MTAAIFLRDAVGPMKPKAVETFTYSEENELKDRLRELQKGYCEVGDDRPKIKKGVRNGRNVIWAFTDCSDFFYIAYVGMRLKIEQTI